MNALQEKRQAKRTPQPSAQVSKNSERKYLEKKNSEKLKKQKSKTDTTILHSQTIQTKYFLRAYDTQYPLTITTLMTTMTF